jgi:glutathione synthase/RimK-type ligase-like ATP-grasp enzyme
MEAVYSGQSDEEVNDDEISTWNALCRLIPLNISWREAFCEPGRMQILCADGSVISRETRLPIAQSSLWLLRLQNGRILPLYATVPPWIHNLSPKGQDVSGRLLPTNEGTSFVRTPSPNQEPTILLLGESTDAILNQISRVAPLVGTRVKFLNQADAYKMPPGSFDQQVLESDIVVNRLSHSQLHTEARYKHFWILRILEKSSKLILNRPSGGATNFSRSVNLMQLKTLGWRIPKTVATNDPDAAHNFIQNCGARTVCKPCSALRADVSMLTMKAVDRLERVANCPVLFQKYVAGNEYRIHSTSKESLGIEISKRAFRFNRHASFSVARLVTSLQISRLCQNTTSSLGLVLAGIDVRKEKDTGNLFALECNSMPAFTAFGRLHSIDVMRSILNLETNDPMPRSEIDLAAG